MAQIDVTPMFEGRWVYKTGDDVPETRDRANGAPEDGTPRWKPGNPLPIGFEYAQDMEINHTAQWIIRGWIPRTGEPILIYGPHGSGKSAWLHAAALAIAEKAVFPNDPVDFMGQEVSAGGVVLYIPCEGKASYPKRTQAMVQGLNAEAQEKKLPLIFRVVPFVLTQGDVRAIVDELEQAGIRVTLVIIDTLAQAMEGDENKAEDIAETFRAGRIFQDRLGAVVALVHHTGKDSTKGSRGSSAAMAGTGTHIQASGVYPLWTYRLTRQKDESAGAVMHCKAIRVSLGEDETGAEITSIRLEACSEEESAGDDLTQTKPDGTPRKVMEILWNIVADQGEKSPYNKDFPSSGVSGGMAAREKALFEALCRRKLVGGTAAARASSEWSKLRTRLINAGEIIVLDEWVMPLRRVR